MHTGLTSITTESPLPFADTCMVISPSGTDEGINSIPAGISELISIPPEFGGTVVVREDSGGAAR